MELTYKKKNIYSQVNETELKKIFDYCDEYKKYLDNSKTEREAVKHAISIVEKTGFKPYALGDKISKGDRLYYNNRGKGLFLIRAGKADIKKHGVRILVAHIDSPRLDIKQVPLYEKNDTAYLKTHYYGGIKKYQWLTIPLALHGVIALKNGKSIELAVGEDDGDPVFYITDLLPHLSQELNVKSISEGFKAEKLNIVVGGIPAAGETSDAVKLGILKLLNTKYGICEDDFLSAELEAVPAAKARDVGFDRAFVASYGHDDSVCAYPEITATLEADTDNTTLTILADKEEIGSDGNTGMQCVLVNDILNEIAQSYGVSPAVLRSVSKCISADVTSAFDPDYASAFEEQNVGLVSHGVCMIKFTGSRGKSESNDASAEYIAYLRNVFDKAGVIWQTGEIGRVDLGGGGTIAKYIAQMNIDTVDLGVPVLSMHAPYELVSKADIYHTHKAFLAFLK